MYNGRTRKLEKGCSGGTEETSDYEATTLFLPRDARRIFERVRLLHFGLVWEVEEKELGCEMDAKISRLIMEFLVREGKDDEALYRIIVRLTVPEDDFWLKKSLLLRGIKTELNNASVSEKLLDLMELIKDLDFEEGKVTSETLKAAYCAVAIHCIVRFLKDLDSSGKYMEILSSFWRDRVQKLLSSKSSELISQELWCWRDDLESAISDVLLLGEILSRNTKNEAIKAVEDFLAEAWDDLGPSDLEKIAEDVIRTREIVNGTPMDYDSMIASMNEKIFGGKDNIENDMLVEEPSQQQIHVSEIQSVMITSDGPSGNVDDGLATHGSDQSLSLHDVCPEAEKIADLAEMEVSRLEEGVVSGDNQSPHKNDENPADDSSEDLTDDDSPGADVVREIGNSY